jgi:hypothetical protein
MAGVAASAIIGFVLTNLLIARFEKAIPVSDRRLCTLRHSEHSVCGLSWRVLPHMADLHKVQSLNPIQLSYQLDGSTFADFFRQAGDDGQCIHWQATAFNSITSAST